MLLGMLAGVLLALAWLWSASYGDQMAGLSLPPVAAAAELGDEVAGEEVYVERCSPCHGLEGDGDGPVARFLNPRPRDFTAGQFKLRTTSTGEAPLDTDLIQTVKNGIPGTAMPTWEGTLSDEEIRNVLSYVKTFDPGRFDPAFPPEVVPIGEPPPITDELIAQGKAIYERVQCWKCHGDQGRADGPSAPTLEDDWGALIRPRNLTKGWTYKREATVEGIYTRFSTGMDGSPMPSFLFDIPDDERWALASYVETLIRDAPDTSKVVLRSKLISGEMPKDPDDPRWEEALALDVPMTGQVIAAPRWQNPSVDMLTVKSLYNEGQIAFLLTWDDPHKDTTHEVGVEDDTGLDGTYVDWDVYGPKPESADRSFPTYRDAIALQLPRTIPEAIRKPHFLWGRSSDPVNLWMWKSDLNEEAGDASAVEKFVARGHLVDRSGDEPLASLTERMEQLLTPYSPENQDVWGQGVWKDGAWQVVMIRDLTTEDPQDSPLEPGVLIPISFQAWDGSNGERGLMMSISSWEFLLLETPTPMSAYLYTLLGILAAAAGQVLLVRRLKRRRQTLL